jgi:hypothetical protein
MPTPGGAELEAWTVLAGLARETTRIGLGTLVTVTPFDTPPFSPPKSSRSITSGKVAPFSGWALVAH